MQGHLQATGDPSVVLTTILGSCVSACLFDSEAKIGGMNHFLLPMPSDTGAKSIGYGAYAMELLINDLLKQGAQKHRMVAKVFGGADMLSNDLAVGSRNVRFTLSFLQDERIPCISKSLGGQQARRLRFWPETGVAKVKLVDSAPTLLREIAPVEPDQKPGGDIELF